jgi:hyaluronoglucosaminidase
MTSPSGRWNPWSRLAPCALALAVTAAGVGCSGDDESDQGGAEPGDETPTSPAEGTDPVLRARDEPLPAVTPTPQTIGWLGPDVVVPSTVEVVSASNVDAATSGAVIDALEAAGARDIRTPTSDDPAQPDADEGDEGDEGNGGGDLAARLVVTVGAVADPSIAAELADLGLDVPADLPPEGYALAAFQREGGTAEVLLAGADPAGTFYAAQTLRQLVDPDAATIAAVGIVDRPAMRHRGAIEGFYGSPWTHEERLDQLDFYGRFKLNTYIYAPKDDPYHRDRWRDPYPPDVLADLRVLVGAAARNHVRFTFAVSPGTSICYSDPGDVDALVGKLNALYDVGVRAFSIALDDIVHTRWNCDGDGARYGPPSSAAAARAQVELLNGLQRSFIAAREGAQPLQMVPTEYSGIDDSSYRTLLREQLDPAVEVMWTGSIVVPAEITVDEARGAGAVFGRPPFVWDNTPVNDFPATEGRLILAPYDRRQPGLAAEVTGVVLNPMNQAAASKVQLVGAADFAWNDTAYDPARAHRAAATHLAGGSDAGTVDALLAFFDVQNLAPTSASSGAVSQPQAPQLAARLETFRSAWAGGDRAGAVRDLRGYAETLADAAAVISRRVPDAAFVADCRPWLDATALWGRALVATLDALDAETRGDPAAAEQRFGEATSLADQAAAIRTIPGETVPQGPVKVADGVLDAFIAAAPGL